MHSFWGKEIIIGRPWKPYDHGFEIPTTTASQIVVAAVDNGLIRRGNRVLDLGCGKNPRNALYLAQSLGCFVEGVDSEMPLIPPEASQFARSRLLFHEASVLEFEFGKETYHAAILARLLQYLPPECLLQLLQKTREALVPRGVVLLSYTAEGGVLNKASGYAMETYSHPIEEVVKLIESSGLKISSSEPGAPQSTNVPHAGEPAVTYDITARKV